MISKLTLNQIKLDLIKSLSDYGIRIFFQTKYYADTSLSTTITLYNEKKLFGNKLTDIELLCKNDINYHKQVILSFLQKHERFSHFKKTLNKNERDSINSPRGYINFENNQLLILSSKENKKLGEIGETLEYFLTNGNTGLIDNLYKCKSEAIDFKDLFKNEFFLNETNNNLIDFLKNLPKEEENINDYLDENDYISESNKKETGETLKKIIEINKNLNFNKEESTDNQRNTYLDQYLQEKCKIMNENIFRKFTFFRNSIIRYKIDKDGKLVPFE